MARKSRIAGIQTAQTALERVYKTALYVRLSNFNCGRKDNDTVETQEALLRQFIEYKPQFSLVSVYIDNGESGTNFQRDEFERLIEDVRAGEIDCIIVKDLSRFGRNYLEAGEYLEKIFPFLGIRFIAVNDQYDSIDPSTSDNLLMHLKNLVNDIYARDISHKICPVFRSRQEKGEFIGSWAAYGYMKSMEDGHKIVIDPETAPVVQDMYTWRLSGMSYQKIARKLDELHILSPSQYRYKKGLIKNERFSKIKWNSEAVKLILSSETYIGNMEQGKHREALWNGEQRKGIPKSEWIVVPYTHEPIIEKEVFYAVKELNEKASTEYFNRREKAIPVKNSENILLGLVYCGNCGAKLTRYKTVYERKKKEPRLCVSYSYICPVHAASQSRCSFVSIKEETLLSIAFEVIQAQMLTASKIEKRIQGSAYRASFQAERQELIKKIGQTKAEISRTVRLRETLYDDYADHLMNEHDYLYGQERYRKLETALQQKLEELEAEEQALRSKKTMENPWLQAILPFRNEFILTRKMAETLIERITVYSDTTVTVQFRFESECQRLKESLTSSKEAVCHG